MSRSIKFAKAGGPEVLEFVEVQVPAPGPNEVRIKVKAIGINRAEAMWRVDDYIERVKFPAGLGYEAAGTVDAVGKDVGGFAVGDEVNVIPSFSLNRLLDLWRGHPRTGPCRCPAAEISFVHRGRLSLDDVRDRLWRAHRGREGRQGRLRSHSGGLQ
jgi:threonine dehydrogenase-like Zn-dependent dehydrogenase